MSLELKEAFLGSFLYESELKLGVLGRIVLARDDPEWNVDRTPVFRLDWAGIESFGVFDRVVDDRTSNISKLGVILESSILYHKLEVQSCDVDWVSRRSVEVTIG